jgi:hypothetical protein
MLWADRNTGMLWSDIQQLAEDTAGAGRVRATLNTG